ncbi:unnamed protein product [Rotaria magnacalcarata]|uniref:HAT C-terminal dimerisation domain-containing protein n=7 Tax=Rotaria magnacalcarata TaxID=392030 RepID=A0A816T6Y8_9BILA|nr:unnamed protein product [Rotaria magnacalcarata]
MPAENRDVYSGSNHLPPRPQTRSNSLRTRPSRSSTDNHILHRTLASRSPSSSSIIRRRRESSIQQNDRLKKSAYSSIINTNSRSSSGLTSINNSRYVDSLHNNEDDDECDMRSDTVSVIELNNQNRLVNENINSNKLPFEIDEHTTQKKTTTASGKKLSTEVYQLFEKQSEGMHKCTLCINELKVIKQTGRGTANLRSHLLVHKLTDYAFKSQEEQRVLKINKTSSNHLAVPRKREIDEAVLNCIVEGGLPFNLFNHDAIIKLLDLLEPGYKPPDRGTLSLRLHNQYHHHILDLKSVLPHIGPIAFTSDLWKDVSRQHIISLSLHTFSMEFDFVSLPLSFHQFNEQKLAVNIRSFFEYEKERFGLGTRILSGITTDNGPDIKSGASSSVLGPRYACLAHCLNLVVHHGTCVWDLPNPKRFPFDSMYEEVTTSLVDDEDDEMTSEIPPDSSIAFMVNEECSLDGNARYSGDYSAFHMVEENVSSEKPITNEDIYNLLIRIHRLVQKVRTFVSIARLVGSIQRYVYERIGPNKGGFILDVKVRWNSTFKMIDRLLNLRSLVDEIFAKRDFNGLTSAQETKLRSIMFTYDDWELLTALHDCLSPFDKATTILSGDYPTQSMSYFVLQTLKENVQQKFNPTYYHTIINKSLNFQSEYYLEDFLPGAQKLAMKVAAFLDPLFHGDLILYKEDYEAAKQLLTQNMQQMDLTSPDTSTIFSSSTSQALSSTTNSDRMMSFKSSLMNVTRKKASPPLSFQPVSVDLEMAIFLNLIRDNESMDFQMFWKNNARALPRLNQLARRYNIIPATSVYLEQQFSVAGAIKNIRRASMSSLSLRSLIILKKKDKIEKIRLFAHKQ